MQIQWSRANRLSCLCPGSAHVAHGRAWGRALWALLLFLGLLAGWACGEAWAQGPEVLYSGTSPVPVGVTRGRLAAQIVEAAIEERQGRTFASVRCSFHIQNTQPLTPQIVTIGFLVNLPDGFVFDPQAFSNVAVAVDGKGQTLVPLQSASPVSDALTVTTAYTLALNLPPDGTAIVGLNFRQDLGDGVRPTFRFATSVGSRWPGPISSSRVTVRFPWPTSQEQMLSIQPANATFDGQQMTWYASDFEPTQDVILAFVRPGLWQEIGMARLEVTKNSQSAEAHYQLASLYRQLVPTSSLTGTLESPFRALMVAELEATKQTASPADQLLVCKAHQELAALHRARATRPDGSVDGLYLSQAMRELEETVQVCPSAELGQDLNRQVREGYLYLARGARGEGHYETALQYLDSAERVPAKPTEKETFQQEVARERRLCYLYWVRDLFQQGDTTAALKLAETGLETADFLPSPKLVPRFSTVQMSVLTDSTRRQITLSLRPYLPPSASGGKSEAVEGLREKLAGALASPVKVTSSKETYLLEMALSFADGADLFRKQSDLARALPDWPELAFVLAVLSPKETEMGQQEGWFTRQARYREAVDARDAEMLLLDREKACEQEQARLEAAEKAEATEPEAQALTMVRRQALAVAQRAWQSLLDDSRATFEMEWSPATGGHVQRAWLVKAGQTQEMRLDSQAYKVSSILTAAGLVVLAVLIIVLVLFLVAKLS